MLAFTFATNNEMRGIAPEAAIATSPPRMSKLNTWPSTRPGTVMAAANNTGEMIVLASR